VSSEEDNPAEIKVSNIAGPAQATEIADIERLIA